MTHLADGDERGDSEQQEHRRNGARRHAVLLQQPLVRRELRADGRDEAQHRESAHVSTYMDRTTAVVGLARGAAAWSVALCCEGKTQDTTPKYTPQSMPLH